MAARNPDIAIIGAGPSGCALACFLRQRGAEVVIFDNGKRPDLLVGESLIPAAIPLIQRIGIEEQIKQVSVLKPGATLLHAGGLRIDLGFRANRGKAPGYAYNIPRPAFDSIIAERAKELGVRFVHQRAQLLRTGDIRSDREISLSDTSLDAAGLSADSHPALLVDATGRNRLFARLLDIESTRGNRNDTAYFAHFENCAIEEFPPGQIIITVLKQGWSWRIPLQGKTSVGVVLNKHAARQLGDTPQARLETTIRNEPLLAKCMAGAHRISNVKSYSNYQLISTRGHGPGWVMVGDAFGFVDPMLSPGVFMALESAALLDQNIRLNRQRAPELSLFRYSKEVTNWHTAWQEVIEYLYDGRLLQLYEAGRDISASASKYSGSRFLDWYYRRLVSQLVSGVATRSRFKRHMLKAGATHLIDPEIETSQLAVLDS